MLKDVTSPSRLAVELFQEDVYPVPAVVQIQHNLHDVLQQGSTGGLVRHVRIDDVPCGASLPVVVSARDISGNIATSATSLTVATPDISPPRFDGATPKILSVTRDVDGSEPEAGSPVQSANATVLIGLQLSEPAAVACIIEACIAAPQVPHTPGHSDAEHGTEGVDRNLDEALPCATAAPGVGRILREAEGMAPGAQSVAVQTVAAGTVNVDLPDLEGTLSLRGHLVRSRSSPPHTRLHRDGVWLRSSRVVVGVEPPCGRWRVRSCAVVPARSLCYKSNTLNGQREAGGKHVRPA